MMPNVDIFSTFVRARSRFKASRNARSTARWCFSSRMSMKSVTISPPRSRSRSCRVISLAASRFIWYAVSSALLSAGSCPSPGHGEHRGDGLARACEAAGDVPGLRAAVRKAEELERGANR
jgi:hypothetical protein